MSDGNKEEKQFGLIVPGKNRLTVPKPGNIFGEESGSDGDDGTDWVRKALRAEGEKNKVKKQTQLTMKKALKEDPTVYQYDEVYDEIERTKEMEKTSKKTVEKKAKYIDNLLKAADRRKREQEHRVERMVQKEREAEGAMFADKESFVTSAYRAKLEEFRKMEDEEKRMDRLESIGDVTKQQDISGFYRHLYSQTVDDKKETEVKEEKLEAPEETENLDGDDPQTSDPEEGSEHETMVKGATKRQYRKRMAEESQSSSESEKEETEKVEVKEKEKEKKRKLSSDVEKVEVKKRRDSGAAKTEKNDSTIEKEEEKKKDDDKDEHKEKDGEKEDKPKAEEKKPKKKEPVAPKINIWEKRTVGPIFEAALERYYARKAARSSG